MYLDSAYIAKYYVNEPDAPAVRKLIRKASDVCSSAWALAEVTCVFHRHVREGALTTAQGLELMELFRNHVESGRWGLAPVSDALLRRTAVMIRSLAPHVPLRAADAIHLAAALDAGETEIRTSDRHLLAAAPHAGIKGRTI
jgi:predicted nucleic acid-binding protein